MGPLTLERLTLRDALGYWPRIRRPRSFNEKLAHRRFFEDPASFTPFADKFTVRDYVRDTVGEHILNPLLAVSESFDAIPWATLPDNFVVKATHGSGWSHFVERNTPDQLAIIREKAALWLRSVYGRHTHERWYTLITPRLIVEPVLTDTRFRPPPDFKCFTFHGRVHYIQLSRNRFTGVLCRLYDREWNPQPWGHHHPPAPAVMPAPPLLDQILKTAETLAKPFSFVRIDLYCPDDRRIVFGEMTFAPGAGRQRFNPDQSQDFVLGSLW